MKPVFGALIGLLVATSAYGQSGSSVRQSSNISPNHVPTWITNGVIGDGGTAADSPITSLGVTSNTTAGFCISSGRSTAAGRQQLCFGAPLAANAVISLQSYGTATAKGLDFIINGVTASLPSGGGDFLAGTGPYVAGGIPCFTSTTSAVTDCGLVVAAGVITTGTWHATPIALGYGGTGGTDAPTARTNLGLGTMATQAASAVAVTGGTITGMPTPSGTTDVANKAYVDATSSGLNILAQSTLATAAVLPNTPSYSNGASGVGATLTAGSNTTLTVDGTAAPLATVVLVKNQASAFQNGIYTVTTAGGGVPWVLTRATYFDQAAEMRAGSYTFITGGTVNPNSSWTLQTAVTTVGSDSLTFNQFASSGTAVTSVVIAAGTGLATSGTCTITSFGTCTVSLTSPVTATLGGTGVNNGSSTITLGGPLVTAGAFTTTITSTATTNSTLPAGSHTLAGLDVQQTWTNYQAFSAKIGIGATAPASVELQSILFNGNSQFGTYYRESQGTNLAATFIVFDQASTISGSINQNGASAVIYNTTSDRRLKDDLRPLSNVRREIASLSAYDFRWKKSGERSRGFIAQEVYEVFPEAVAVGNGDKMWAMDYGRITPLLWANAQDANARIDALEKEIATLRGIRVRYGLH